MEKKKLAKNRFFFLYYHLSAGPPNLGEKKSAFFGNSRSSCKKIKTFNENLFHTNHSPYDNKNCVKISCKLIKSGSPDILDGRPKSAIVRKMPLKFKKR